MRSFHLQVPVRLALRGQIARSEKEFADCVNCVSAKTREGKQRIQDISLSITLIRVRTEQAGRLIDVRA